MVISDFFLIWKQIRWPTKAATSSFRIRISFFFRSMPTHYSMYNAYTVSDNSKSKLVYGKKDIEVQRQLYPLDFFLLFFHFFKIRSGIQRTIAVASTWITVDNETKGKEFQSASAARNFNRKFNQIYLVSYLVGKKNLSGGRRGDLGVYPLKYWNLLTISKSFFLDN